MFSVRLVTADSYQAQPLPQLDPTFSEFRGSEIKHVPIIRIFGTTSNGEKTCLHIHGVFPYLFVPYTGEEDPGILAYRLAASLDAAINVSLGSATANTQHVYLIQRVSGVPFYGYHRKEHQFLKIYFYNPAMIKRAADLLQNGSVLNQNLQPHEAHINYILQFMMDYNIYGMSLINLRSVKHRRVAQTLADLTSSGQSVSSENSDTVYLPINIERQSTCEIEIDGLASDIMNRLEIEKSLELNPGLAAIWDEERARRAQAGFQGGDSQLVNPKSPARPTFNPTDNDLYQEQRLARRLLMISQCDESTLSTTSNSSVAYAAEVREGDTLLNSSRVPNISVQTDDRHHNVGRDDSLGNLSFLDSPTITASQRLTPDCSILGTDDMPLVDLLVQLARENEENSESIDTDSLLGSQLSVLLNNEKSDNEDEDVVDLNLTCVQLDSLDLLETGTVKKRDMMKSSTSNTNLMSTVIVSPFLTSCAISSRSSKTPENNDTEKRGNESRDRPMPQYDGAGDVSPNLLTSDNEDIQDNATNAKEFNHRPDYNGTCEITSESRKSKNRDQSMKLTSRTSSTITNIPSDITIEYVSSKNNDVSRKSCERNCHETLVETLPAGLTNDTTHLGQYAAIGYEPFDRLLEIGTDFVPDFEDMNASMDIGILLSSADSDKAESVGETVNDGISLDTVLNGDPCFTESAELDKSDLTELRDQYVSLFGNSLLPEIHTDPRVSCNLDDPSNITEATRSIVEKSSDNSTNDDTSCSAITSRDSSSSTENVAPNIQEPDIRGCSKINKLDDDIPRDSENCTQLPITTADNSDYNCNVVATWAELQNLQFVDKSEVNGRLRRGRREKGKYQPGPRSMKRGIRRTSPDQVTSQVLNENTEKIQLPASKSCPGSPDKLSRSSDKSSAMKMTNLSPSSLFAVEKINVETRTSEVVAKNSEERLSCGPLPHFGRLSHSSNEDSSEHDFPVIHTTASLDAFHRSIIGSTNPFADRNTLSGAQYSLCSLKDNVNSDVSLIANFEEIVENRLENADDTDNIDSQISHDNSHYSSQRSHNRLDLDNYQHRHCVLSKFNKVPQDVVFTSNDIWIIQKRKRGKQINFRPITSVCTRRVCKLPVVSLQKIDQQRNAEIVVTPRKNGETINEDLARETSNENVEIPENRMSEVTSVVTCEKKVELPQEQKPPTVRKKRKKCERKLLMGNVKTFHYEATNDDSINSSHDTKRDPYNTRRRSISINFGKLRRRNVRRTIENETKKHIEEIKKSRPRTRYKEPNLPGIPGIVKYETPKKRRRSRKNVTSVNNRNNCDNVSEQSPKPMKIIPSKLFPNWGAQRETQKYRPNGMVKKSTANGLIRDSRKVEIMPEKCEGLKTRLSISPIPKSPRKISSRKLFNFSSIPEKLDKTRYEEPEKIRVSTRQAKLPENVALSLMMQETKSRSTRMALKLLLKKRINDKRQYENKRKNECNGQIKTLKINNEKSNINKIVTAVIMENPIAPPTPLLHDDTRDQSKAKESGKTQEVELNMESTVDSDPAAFQTVTDVSDTISEKNRENCDTVLISSLNDPTEIITNVNEFDDGSTLSEEFCNSVDDGTTDMFDVEAGENSVITETANVEELANDPKQLTYDTDRYENAIKEASFFAGNDYTIGAVSLEIPTCLFEEDSNSVDKRIPKKINESNTGNFTDSYDTNEDTSSELSIDPRDLDVYDVQSLTPSSIMSVHDESIYTAESSGEISETDDFNVVATKTNEKSNACVEESIEQQVSTCIVNDEEIVAELESSFEEDSPSFEALSPIPRVCSSVGELLEAEFTVHSSIEAPKSPVKCDKTATILATIPNKNSSLTIENSLITPNKKHSITIEKSSITPTKNISLTTDNCSILLDSPPITIGNSRKAIHAAKEVGDENAKLDEQIKELVSQVVVEFQNELEISDVNDTESISIIDIEIQLDSDQNIAESDERVTETSLSNHVDKELFINSSRENDASAIIQADEKLPTGCVEESNMQIFVENENEPSLTTRMEAKSPIIVEKDDKLLDNCDNESELLMGSGHEKEVLISTSMKTKSSTILETDNKRSECSENESELPMTCEKDNNHSASTHVGTESTEIVENDGKLSESSENETEVSMTCRKEKEASVITSMETESPMIVKKHDQFPEISEYESKLLMSCEKEKEVPASTYTESESPDIVEKADKALESSAYALEWPTTCEKEKELSAGTQVEIDSSMIIEKDAKLSETSENESELSSTCVKEKDLSTSTHVETESPKNVGKDKEILESSEKKSELPITCETEKELSAGTQVEIYSSMIIEKDVKLSENSENESELSSTCVKETDLSESTNMETESPKIVEKDDTLMESSENESERLITCDKEKDLTKNIHMETESLTIVEKGDKLPENTENESKLPITYDKEKDDSIRTQLETESSMTVENEKLPKSRENELVLLRTCEKENDQTTPLEIKSSTSIEKCEKLSVITEKETTPVITAEVNQKSVTSVESTIKHTVIPEKHKHFTATTKSKNELIKMISKDEKEPEITGKKIIKQSIIPIKSKQLSSKESRKKKIQSKIENEETEKKDDKSESTIITKDNEISENLGNVPVVIDKNDVVSIPETEHRDSSELQAANVPKITKSVILNENCSSEPSKKRVECRPVSIKLVNIDLSKIRCFKPKNLNNPKIEEQALSQVIKQTNEKETLLEKVAMKSELRKNSRQKGDNGITFENFIEETKSQTVNDVEKLTTMESQSLLRNHSQRAYKKFLQSSRMPERRSVRICAEMTLRLSQQENSSKAPKESEPSRNESTRVVATKVKVLSEPSLTPNIKEKISQESTSLSTKILDDLSQSKSPQAAPTVISSMDENSQKITEYSTTTPDCQSSRPESVDKEIETNNSQDLVLSEQRIADENAAPSSIRPKRRGRSGKSPQTNSQEVTLAQKIYDENTEPIFDKPKRNERSRKNAQVNLQETFGDSKPSKPMAEEGAQKIANKTSTVIDLQPECESNISATNIDAQSLIVASKRARSTNNRHCKIRNSTRIRKHSPSKSARAKNSREVTKISIEPKSSMEETSTNDINQDTTLPAIFSLPTSNTDIGNITLKNFVVPQKSDESISEKQSLPEETLREIMDAKPLRINVSRRKIGNQKPEQQISIVHKRRGRSEKSSETRDTSSYSKLSWKESVDDIAMVSLGHELSSKKNPEENTDPKTPITRKRRRRSEKIVEISTSSLKYKSVAETTTRDVLNSQESELLPEKNVEESNEPELPKRELATTLVTLKRRGRSGKSPETKPDSQESELSLQRIMDTTIESRISVIPKRRDRPGKSSEMYIAKLSSEESSQGSLKEKYSQDSQLLLKKITDDNIVSEFSAVSKRRGRSTGNCEVYSEKLKPNEDARTMAEIESREPTLVLRKIVKENVEQKICSVPNRQNNSEQKQEIYEEKSSTQEMSINSHESKLSLQEVPEDKKRKDLKKSKGRFINIPSTMKNCSDGSTTLPQGNVNENTESTRTCGMSVRRGRSGKVSGIIRPKFSMSQSKTNENSHAIMETTTELTVERNFTETQKTFENNTVLETLRHEFPITNIESKRHASPKKRVRFNEESIRKCAMYRQDDESSFDEDFQQSLLKKNYNLSLSNRFRPPAKVIDITSASDENLNESIRAKDSELPDLESVCLFMRLESLCPQERETAIIVGDKTVGEAIKSTSNSNDNVSLDFSSLEGKTKRSRKLDTERVHDIPGESSLSDSNDLECETPTLKLPHFHLCTCNNTKLFWPSRRQVMMYVRLPKPRVVLKRLSRELLKSYGIAYRPKNKIFVKILKTSNHKNDDDYNEFPAYDGAADLSSSDTDDDPDLTIESNEKRVCVYSSKKITPAKPDSIATPKKRKLDIDDIQASGPSRKRQTIVTTVNNESTKTPYRSPSRTSMLKSPGRTSGNYSPLKIIVTSPKVRKEILEPRASSFRLDKHDDNANASSSGTCVTTPRRKNSRLHDNLLRGKFTGVKSSLYELGDKHAPMAKMGSDGLGELDEIKCTGKTEHGTAKIVNSMITSDCYGSPAIRSSTTTLRDGKDVRKKLIFSDKEDKHVNLSIGSTDVAENVTDLPITESHEESTKLQISSERIERSSRLNDNNESMKAMETPDNPVTKMFDTVAGSSRGGDNPNTEDRESCEITTDPDSDDDDVCNVTFTQYVNSQTSKIGPSSSLDPDENSAESMKRIIIMPKFKPPSRQRVIETMETYGIPKYRNQEPFFSNSTDVSKQKELAQKMLKVPGNSINDFPSFVSSVKDVTGLARWRKMWLNEFHPSLAKSKEHVVKSALAGNERVIITPIIRPPTQRQVKNWLRARQYLEEKRNEDREESKKILNEPKKIEIQDEAVADKNDECSSNASDLSIIESSPEKILLSDDPEKSLTTTLKMKLVKKELIKRANELARCKIGKKDETMKSQNPSGSSEKSLTPRNTTGNEMDSSLLSILGKSRLFRNQESSRQLGISCGQIEFLSDSTRSNVANENLQNAKALTRYQYLTIMCLEVHVITRGDLLPDAQHDAIAAIFYSLQNDVPPTSSVKPLEHGVIVLGDTEKSRNKMYYSYASQFPWTISFANNEEALLNSLVNLITRADPEILIGWEIETLSWGYVFQRASHLGMNLFKRISRIPATQCKWEAQTPDIETLAEIKLPGRIVLDIWRLMRHEAALLSYTFESVIHHVLNERIPCPSFKILTEWWNLEKSRHSRWRVVEHYSIRVLGVFRILDQLDIIGRTSELARLFGIQFFEVFSRGSQFRVESVMLRLAKPLNYIAVSPSPLQRASMRAMEALPLIMEPESMFYSDPLIVLDFQSLYPSIIIAHNYCFSTCLGRIEHIGQPQPFEFGAYTLRVPKRTALKLQGKVSYAPCGVAYVKSEVRLGILPRMLTEILETRFMVKKAMKDHNKNDKTLQRALHSRQMGLKFLANVTYGYTAANFSGRMPCIEVGDSVISKSKETLERAIKLVESTPKWGARVVYGDTDSLFILVPGKSKADAFVIGNEIADAVTASNPPPIKLKFEKVLYPAILQTKKRYCGYMYETPDQENPTYLAKGIETVRRDGCPAVSKILEKTLKILFETKDVSLVKKYVTRQLDKVLRGKVSIQDLTFAKEFRGLKGYKAKACVPALELTRRLMKKDPRAVPRNNERVRYVIVAGAPNQALIHCVRTPWELIRDPGLRPNAIYYVTRVIIPPLNRCLNLMGVDVNAWYREMPHRQILDNPVGQPSDKQKLTIFQYFGTIVCVSCGQPSNKGICVECLDCPEDTLVVIYEKLRWLDRTNNQVTAICRSCVGQADAADCSSLDCPVLYRRAHSQRELTQAIQLREIIECGNNLEF